MVDKSGDQLRIKGAWRWWEALPRHRQREIVSEAGIKIQAHVLIQARFFFFFPFRDLVRGLPFKSQRTRNRNKISAKRINHWLPPPRAVKKGQPFWPWKKYPVSGESFLAEAHSCINYFKGSFFLHFFLREGKEGRGKQQFTIVSFQHVLSWARC